MTNWTRLPVCEVSGCGEERLRRWRVCEKCLRYAAQKIVGKAQVGDLAFFKTAAVYEVLGLGEAAPPPPRTGSGARFRHGERIARSDNASSRGGAQM